MPVLLEYAHSVRRVDPRWLAASCLLVGTSLVALAINVRDGEYWPSALLLLTFAIPLCIAGTFCREVADQGWGVPAVTLATLAAIAVALLAYELSPAGGWNTWSNDLTRRTVPGLFLFYTGAWVAWLLVALTVFTRRGRNIVAVCAFAIHLIVGVWFIRAAPNPLIDVFVFQQQAGEALLEGNNPYDITFHDIYNSGLPGSREVYAPELSQDGQLKFGFPYPPLSLYLSTAGYALSHDHRYAQLLSMALTGLIIAFMRNDSLSLIVAMFVWFMPRGFFILGRGWTEPFVALFMAATVICALRFRRLLPVALGLLLASKQYTAFIVPLSALLIERPFRWQAYFVLLAKAVAIALLVTLPLALWDFRAFWHSLVTVQRLAPFRDDALSYLVWFHHKTGIQLGVWPAFLAAALATIACLWRAARTPFGFGMSVGTVYLLFITLNKQAFANYYYFTICALWCGVAAMPAWPGHTRDPESSQLI